MKIKRLYIGDVGIYRNALMENISPGIVLVGGFNRSGKSTLLEILRHVPYGFTKRIRSSILEPSIDCDFEDNNKNTISVKLSGLSEPRITINGDSQNTKLKEVYTDIDRFTYSQLYTITLDELRRLNAKGEEEKLQSVLLGAGVSDIVHIPKLLESMSNEKIKIGGKTGNPNVKLFKPFYEKLLSGIEERENALKQIDKYTFLKEQEIDIKDKITELEGFIEDLKLKFVIYEVLESYFEDYRTVESLKQEISSYSGTRFGFDFDYLPSIERIEAMEEEYSETLNGFKDIKNKFEQNYNIEKINYILLLENEEKIKYYIKNASGLKQKKDELSDLKNKYEAEKENILKTMSAVNVSFKGDFIKVLNIECDTIKEAKLIEVFEDIKAVNNEMLQWKTSLESESLQGEVVKKGLDALNEFNPGGLYKNQLYSFIVILFLSIITYFINKTFAMGLLLVGFTAIGIYYFVKKNSLNQVGNKRVGLELELKSSMNKQSLFKEKISRLQIKKAELNKIVSGYKESLQLDKEIPDLLVMQYFNDIKNLKNKIIDLGVMGRKIESYKRDLLEEFHEIHDCVSCFMTIDFNSNEATDKFFDEIFYVLECLEVEIEASKLYYTAERRLTDTEEFILERLQLEKNEDDVLDRISKILDEYRIWNRLKEIRLKLESIETSIGKALLNERINSALIRYKESNIDNLQFLYNMYTLYPIKNELIKEKNLNGENLKAEEIKLESLRDKHQIIKIDIVNLASSEKLEEAQRLIDEGRLGLKPLAVKYSIYHAAEQILQMVQKDFLDNAKYKLLKGAGLIFSEITSGQYKAVLPGDNLLQTEYKTVEKEKDAQETASILSRGTGEQLYLSVRLSRIKEMKQKPPIIFDDPFVNFDEIHVKNTLKVISELSKENQIFILTCHPEIVKLINNINPDVQCWKLIKGSFSPSNGNELIEYLSQG